MEKRRALILDMDGVLIDSERYWELAINELIRGIVADWDDKEYPTVKGSGAEGTYRMIQHRLTKPMGEEEFVQRMNDVAHVIYQTKSRLYEGARELLRRMRTEGKRVALASSSKSDWVRMVLDRFDMADLFDTVVTGSDLHGKAKPAPDIYLQTARQLGLYPGECVAVEDSPNGVASAVAAGMGCIAWRTEQNANLDLSAATTEVRNFARITSALLEDMGT